MCTCTAFIVPLPIKDSSLSIISRRMSAKKRGNSGVPLYHPPGARFQTGNRVYKIVMLGQGGVGKSALTLQFVTHKFQEDHDPTIEDAYQKRAVIDGVPFVLDVLDTAGQDEFTAMREQYMRGGEGFLMVYSVTNKRSFYELRRFKETVNRVRHSVNVPIVVVGNKCDLKSKIEVPIEEGQALGKEFNCPFFETSAALRLNVDESFHEIVRCIQRQELRDYNEGLGGSTSQVGDDKKSNGPSSAGLACCLRPQTDS